MLNCSAKPRIELTKKEWIAPIVEIVIYSRKGFKTWTNIFIIIIEKSYKKAYRFSLFQLKTDGTALSNIDWNLKYKKS